MLCSVVVAVLALPRPLTRTRWLEALNVGALGWELAVLARDINLRGLVNLLTGSGLGAASGEEVRPRDLCLTLSLGLAVALEAVSVRPLSLFLLLTSSLVLLCSASEAAAGLLAGED